MNNLQKISNGVPNTSKSFTLLEVLISVSVLVIGIAAILYMFPVSIQVEEYSQRVSTALQLAQEKMEEEISKIYESVLIGTVNESQLPSPFENYSRQTIIDYVDSDLTSTTTDTGLKKISIKITFKSPLNLSKEIEIVSLIAKR